MTTRPLSRFNARFAVWFAVAFVVWTPLALHTGLFAGIDATSNVPRLAPESAAAQIVSAVVLVTHPIVICAALVILGLWALRRRLRHLGYAVVLAGLLSWLAAELLKVLIRRPLPPSPLSYAISYHGYAYPSSHMAVATAAVVVVVATTTTTRQPRTSVLAARVASLVVLAAIGLSQWLMNQNRFSDLIGGVLLGGAVVALVLLFARVRMLPLIAVRRPEHVARPRGGLCAVIYNPAKVADEMMFRRQIANELAGDFWQPALWLATTPDDAGRAMTDEAIQRGADLVIGAGGDGTIRVVAQQLAGSGIPFGIVPSGTANLFAKNLGVPGDQEDAIRIAVMGRPVAIDLVKLVVDHDFRHPLRFAVMAGIGFDARLMSRTNENLKKAVGALAYVVSAMPELLVKPHRVEITVDGVTQVRRNAVLTVMGNVASIGGGLDLMPEADPTDGQMEMVIGSPSGLSAWANAAAQVLTRFGVGSSLEQYTGRRMSVAVEDPLPYELDGDTVGEGRFFEAEVDPGALLVMLPPSPDSHSAADR